MTARRLDPRAGGHDQVLQRSLAAARLGVPGLTVDRSDDPAVALLNAWATVADVIGFYQQRIAVEGYLRTATERRSLLEIGRAVGYELAPGRAATTLLAFTVEDAADPAASVVVPAGTAVQSIPGQDEQPQTFETGAEFIAYAERNAMRLRLHRPQRIGPDTARIRLSGADARLRSGDPLLIVDGDGAPGVRIVRAVEQVNADGLGRPATTVVTLDTPLPTGGAGRPTLYAFRQPAALFGRNAPDWRLMPSSAQQNYGANPSSPGPQWPGFALTGNPDGTAVIDLDGDYPQVVAGSWLLMRGLPPAAAAGGPGPVSSALFTVLAAAPSGVADFGLAGPSTRVHLRSTARIASFDRRTAVVYAVPEPLALADDPVTEPVTGPALLLDQPVELAAGSPVVVTGTGPAGELIVEAAVVAGTATAEGGALLTLTAALSTPVDPATLVVLGNVVSATHGRTVGDEVLGSGDGGARYQCFVLRGTDLTHTSAPVPGGVRSSLEVRVDGVHWTQHASLYGLGPRDRGYTVRIGDDGSTTVLFGDGECGARLPSGEENVTARYRSGIGPAGNVRAGTVTLPVNWPLGIRSVTNPSAATGGAAPEPAEDGRQAMSRATLALDRVVSLDDHEQFARQFPGIAKASAVVLPAGLAPYVFLTVAGPSGADVDATTLANLRAALDGAGRWGPPPELRNGRRLGVTVSAAVRPAPDRSPAAVTVAVRAAIGDAYSFDRRRFAQPMTAAEVVALIQAVPGVLAVTLRALHVTGEPAEVVQALPARTARNTPGGALPAEILLVDPERITVTELLP
jgi:hypothetical protein